MHEAMRLPTDRWLRHIVPLVSLTPVLIAMINPATARAQFDIGGLIKDRVKDTAKAETIKDLARQWEQEAPTVSSADATFPIVRSLPGGPFHSSGNTRYILSQLPRSADGSVRLLPGDYEIPVRCQCMKASAHSPSGHLYLLAPIKGQRAAMITALNARVVGTNVPGWQVQHLSWDMQAGLRYDQLPADEQAIVSRYLSDYRNALNGSPMDQMRDNYDRYASAIGYGSFDGLLSSGKMGAAGKDILEMERYQTLLQNANTESGVHSLVNGGASEASEASGGPDRTPWSRVGEGVYERLYTDGGFMSTGTLQIRVMDGPGRTADTPKRGSHSGLSLASYSLVSYSPAATPGSLPTSARVPITSLEGEPQNSGIQPLSMVPQVPPRPAAPPVPTIHLPPVNVTIWTGKTLLQAVAKAMRATEPDRSEHGGYVVRNPNGTYTAFEDGQGSPDGFVPGDSPSDAAGSWHTHPPGSEHGSDLFDQNGADTQGFPNYAADPNGNIIENSPRPGHENDPLPVQDEDYNGPGVSIPGRWK